MKIYAIAVIVLALIGFVVGGIGWIEHRAIASAENVRIVESLKRKEAARVGAEEAFDKAADAHEEYRATTDAELRDRDDRIAVLKATVPDKLSGDDRHCRPGCIYKGSQ